MSSARMPLFELLRIAAGSSFGSIWAGNWMGEQSSVASEDLWAQRSRQNARRVRNSARLRKGDEGCAPEECRRCSAVELASVRRDVDVVLQRDVVDGLVEGPDLRELLDDRGVGDGGGFVCKTSVEIRVSAQHSARGNSDAERGEWVGGCGAHSGPSRSARSGTPPPPVALRLGRRPLQQHDTMRSEPA